MHHLIEAVRRSVQEKNWHAALTTALTLPDIAAAVDGQASGRSRYINWFNVYVATAYTFPSNVHGQPPRVFLSGLDCYILRCAFLHQGEFDLTTQPAIGTLERIHFVQPVPEQQLPFFKVNHELQLQVDHFCEHVCVATETWLQARGTDPTVATAIARMPTITIARPLGTITIQEIQDPPSQ